MRAQHLPMATRISAASAAMPFTTPRPGPQNSFRIGCRIIIPHMSELFEGSGCEPRTPANEFVAGGTEDPEQINSETHSFSLSASNSHPAQSETPGPINTETNSTPQTLVDYSTPPTSAELLEIKSAINRLRPDLAHLPVTAPHLCRCGHWMFGPCPLGERCCDRTKLN